ncbi:TPA: dihydroorotase [Streptococcus agalactiae]
MYIIKNGLIIDPQSGFNQVSDMLIDQGKIKQISKEIDIKGIPIIDASNKIVAPGLVDIHVHFREPGQTHKENIHTGALSAAAGGFTTVLMMANTNPTISSPEIVKQVKESAAKEAIKIETVATITKSLNGKDLVNFEELLEAGVAGFSDDGIPLTDTKVLQEAMNLARKHDVVLSLHEEDPSLNGVLGINEHIAQKIYHVCGASGLAEYSMIARDAMIAYQTQAKVHIQHLSSSESVEVVDFAQKLGANLTAEVTPQHFSKTEDLLLTKGANAKLNPPLRLEKDRQALIAGLKSGVISIIASDHAPHHIMEKAADNISQAPSGMTGLETSLALGITYLVSTKELSMIDFLAKMTCNPAQLYGFDAGYLREGGPADIVIFDQAQERIIKAEFASKSSNSPFIGDKLKGVVHYTICNGEIVYQKDSHAATLV